MRHILWNAAAASALATFLSLQPALADQTAVYGYAANFPVGAFGLVVPASAIPLPLDGTSAVIPVIDEETAVEEALEPDVMQPGSQEGIVQPHGGGTVSEEQAVEEALEPDVELPGSQGGTGGGEDPGAGGGGGDGSAGEIPALQEAFPETNWPPSDRKE